MSQGSDNAKAGSPEPMVLNIDFEGRAPTDSDLVGIKNLLDQLFKRSSIDTGELAGEIIAHNYIGSVLKSNDEDDDGSDDDEHPDEGTGAVFGITTVVNLSNPSVGCISEMRNLLIDLCRQHGTPDDQRLVEAVLAERSAPVGLIINERFSNIPSQAALPLFTSLEKDIAAAVKSGMNYSFSHFILISKITQEQTVTEEASGSAQDLEQEVGADGDAPEIVLPIAPEWTNREEARISEESISQFEFRVDNDDEDRAVGGNWSGDTVTVRKRIISIFPAIRLSQFISNMKDDLATQ